MSDPKSTPPREAAATATPSRDPKAERLAEALRANLRRRKAQARGREARDDQDNPSTGAGAFQPE